MSYTTALGITPVFSINKGGEDITSNFADRMVMIKVESRDGGGDADVIDISLDDRDWIIATPSIGEGSQTVQVNMGYAETVMYDLGTFQIDDLFYEWTPKTMRLHGNSLGFSTDAKAPIITSYDGQTLGSIVGSIAQSAGVSPKIDATLGAIQVPYLNQHASSMHLLQELERRFGGLAKFQDGYLSFTARGTGDSASGTSIGTFVLGPEDISGGSINPTNRFSYSKVRAGWWDKVNHQLSWVESTTAGSPNSTVPFMDKKAYASEAEAQSAANSTMSQLNRKTKQGTLTLSKGDPSIRGGQAFSISGCRDGIDGSYVVRKAVHTLSKETGITTSLDVYDDGGDDSDLLVETTDGSLDFTGVANTPVSSGGIGAM